MIDMNYIQSAMRHMVEDKIKKIDEIIEQRREDGMATAPYLERREELEKKLQSVRLEDGREWREENEGEYGCDEFDELFEGGMNHGIADIPGSQ